MPDEVPYVPIPDGGSFAFPDWPLGSEPAAESFHLCNTGAATVTLNNTTSMVSGSGFSQVTPNPAATLNSGDCTSLHVEFEVSSSGSYTGNVSIASNAGSYTFSLQATAGRPEIRVLTSPQGANVVDGGIYTFPTQSVSQLPLSQLFDLCNDGSSVLTISNPSTLVSGFGFAQIGPDPTSTVDPGTCTNFRVRFNVATAGTYTGHVSITNNDADENPFNFTLRATAVSNPEIRIATSPQGANITDGSLYTFPTRSLAQLPVSQLFDLCNDGVDPLTISNPASLVSGTGFSQIGTSPSSTVHPGTCTNFRVRFHVVTTGTYTGAVTIINNDANENPFNISLRGTAVP